MRFGVRRTHGSRSGQADCVAPTTACLHRRRRVSWVWHSLAVRLHRPSPLHSHWPTRMEVRVRNSADPPRCWALVPPNWKEDRRCLVVQAWTLLLCSPSRCLLCANHPHLLHHIRQTRVLAMRHNRKNMRSKLPGLYIECDVASADTTNVVRLFCAFEWHGLRHMYEDSKFQ